MQKQKSDYRFKNGILYKDKEPIGGWGTPRKYRYPYIIFTPQNNKVSGLFAGQNLDTNRINQTYLPTQSKATLPPHLQRICKAEHRIKQIDDNDFDYPETEADKKDPEVQAFKREQANKKDSIDRILEQSKLTALRFLELYPKAKIYPFNPKTFRCITGWEEHQGLTIDEIKNNRFKNVLYGLKMSSVPLVVLDFDIESPDHPKGMKEDTFKELKKEFGLNNYPCFSVGKSGQGGHFWFKQDDNTPKEESNMDLIKGVDYKVNTIMFLINNPFPLGIKDLRSLPSEFLNYKRQNITAKKEGRFFKQRRTSYKALMNGDPKGVFESYYQARKEGQSQTQAFSVAGPSLEKLVDKVESKIINEKTLLTHTEFIEIKKQKPVSFFENLLLHYEWNFLYGKQKIGKSRGLLDIIAKALKNSDKKCAIISSDNDKNIMLSPLFDLMGIKKYFVWIDPKINTYFNPQDLPIVEKIEIYLKRIKEYLTNNPDTICLFIDPLPRFLDWNKEHLVSMFISGMREIARELNRCIIGVRNEGKNRSYDTSDAYKGNSAIGDDSRQVIRSIKCHRRSALGKLAKTKEGKPQKSFVIYTELSSLYGEVGYLFKLEINPDTKIAVPILIKKIEKNVDTIKYLCTPESGKSLANKIFHFIQKGPEKGCTLEDLYDEFEDEHNQDAIKKAVYRNFDHKTISGVTYIQIKKDSQNLTKTHPSP